MAVDVLCMVAHPDDAEILAGGTLIKLKDQGYRVGVATFTRGEMGTRGDAEQRTREAAEAARIMGLDSHETLSFPDAHIECTIENRRPVVELIRRHRPSLVITHDTNNRNPDHTHVSRLVKEAAFTAGLAKYDTRQEPHRPSNIIYCMEYFTFVPNIIVDITDQYERKLQAVACYRSQTHNSVYEGPETYISSDRFMREIDARYRYFGSKIHTDFAEGFRLDTPIEIRDLVEEIANRVVIPSGQGKR